MRLQAGWDGRSDAVPEVSQRQARYNIAYFNREIRDSIHGFKPIDMNI